MRNFIPALTLVSAAALTGCGGGGDEDLDTALAASGGVSREFVLDYGGSIDLKALSLEFTAVSDGRCGVGSSAVCAWEGNAQVFVTATNGQNTQILTLNTSLQYPPSAIFDGRVVELRRLDPLPTFTDIGRPSFEDYSATIYVSDAP